MNNEQLVKYEMEMEEVEFKEGRPEPEDEWRTSSEVAEGMDSTIPVIRARLEELSDKGKIEMQKRIYRGDITFFYHFK